MFIAFDFYVMVDNVVGIILGAKFNWAFNYFYFQLWKLENVLKHKSLFRPPIKNYS